MPAVPEPLDRRRSRSAPTARSTSAAATARASTSSTTARTAARSTRAATRPAASAATLTPPTAEGGALRSQDLRTTGDPVGLDGAIIRVDPATGAGAARQPARRRAPTANARRIVAYGLRNPFRFTIRPGTNEVWVGDVGWNDLGGDRPRRSADRRRVDELRLALLRGRTGGQSGYDGAEPRTSARTSTAGRGRRRRARTSPTTTAPRSSPARRCPTGSSSISGLAFYHRRHLPGRTTARSSSPTTRATASG